MKKIKNKLKKQIQKKSKKLTTEWNANNFSKLNTEINIMKYCLKIIKNKEGIITTK